MKMKKISYLILCCATSLLLLSCDKSPNVEGEKSVDSTTVAKKKAVSPKEITKSFIDALLERNTEVIDFYLSNDGKNKIIEKKADGGDLDDWVERTQQIMISTINDNGGLENITTELDKEEMSENSVKVIMSVHFKNGKEINENIFLKKIDGEWKIERLY